MEAKISRGNTPRCQHCGRNKQNRPRGLCWTCYYIPGVRERYPFVEHRGSRRGALGGDFNGRGPMPLEPTAAAPGTPEKMAVLRMRAAKGEQLFHPKDGPNQ